MEDIKEHFDSLDVDKSGFLEESEIVTALKLSGYKLAPYKVRELIREFDVKQKDGKIDFNEFKKMYQELRKRDYILNVSKSLVTKEGIEEEKGATGSHTVRHSEQAAFSDWINRSLAKDKDCAQYLPISKDGRDLYDKCRDGVLICKVINVCKPDTIDERVINKGAQLNVFQKRENSVLAINSARSIGIVVEGNRPEAITEATKHLVLGLLWQIIKIRLLSNITIQQHKELVCLLRDGETIEDLLRLSPNDLLLRWANFQLERAGCQRRINNFSDDIKDSEAYAFLIRQIAPDDKRRQMPAVQSVLGEVDHVQRAERVLQNAEKIDARMFVTAEDIAGGDGKLNMAFVANLFNTFPALDSSNIDFSDEQIIEETREEKTFRNWMNSLGVKPAVNNLYYDLRSGVIIFQLFDVVRAKVVDWKRVHEKFSKLRHNFEILENCNYAVELGKVCKFSLVGIGGEDLRDGNRTLTLALVWQLMRAYTISLLSQCASLGAAGDSASVTQLSDKAILGWAQSKLMEAGKQSHIHGFQDSSLHDGVALVDLVDAVSPGAVNYDLVKSSASSAEERLENAKYAISVARRSGAMVYALPEDITEVKAKMILTMVASLMVLDYNKQNGNIIGAVKSTPVM